MDRIQSFARVVVGAIAIYFSINVLVMMIMPVGMMLSQGSLKEGWMFVLHLAICALCLVLLQDFGVFRPQKVVSLITRHVEPQQPITQGQWLPAAYRLVCVFTGLYCIYGVLYRAVAQIGLYYYYHTHAEASQTTQHYFIRPDEIATTLVLLVLGIYLLAGAPHFIRWHLRRTVRFCAENPME